jgi:hypothetical protein
VFWEQLVPLVIERFFETQAVALLKVRIRIEIAQRFVLPVEATSVLQLNLAIRPPIVTPADDRLDLQQTAVAKR